jgi:N-methylhydantoinase A
MLGRLSPGGLLGGGMALDVEAARRCLKPMAEQLGMSVERAAHGILGIVAANMVRAIRAISVERGHDPRDFALLPFGGAGPLHAADVARALDIRRIVVPTAPGILCAQGLVASDLREGFVHSGVTRVDDDGMPRIHAAMADLHRQAEDWFAREGVAPAQQETEVGFDMRYVGQNYELAVEGVGVGAPDAEALRETFFAVHERNYGYFNPDDPVEVVNVRLTAVGRFARRELPRVEADASRPPVPVGERPVWFGADAAVTTPVYDRDALEPGHRIAGPAVIEQMDSTTLVFPDDGCVVDAAGNLIIEVAP